MRGQPYHRCPPKPTAEDVDLQLAQARLGQLESAVLSLLPLIVEADCENNPLAKDLLIQVVRIRLEALAVVIHSRGEENRKMAGEGKP